MEALNLLKYWKTNSNRTTTATGDHKTTSSTAIVSTVKLEQNEAEPEDDGPFFDLKLAVAEQNVGEVKIDGVESLESDDEELKATFAVTGCNGNGEEAAAAAAACAVQVVNSSEELQAAKPRFRVFMLGSNKSKSKPKSAEETESPKQQEAEESEAKSTKLEPESSSKLFTVMKFRAEDVPFVSLFTKSASNNGMMNHKSLKQNTVESARMGNPVGHRGELSNQNAVDSDRGENGFSAEVVHKYLTKKVKPLYIRISKPSINLKLGLNTRAKAKAGTEAEAISNVKSLVSGLRIGSNNSAKSKTALAAVAAAPTVVISSRRDDSLLQQQDGIQSAILHCKRSFNDSN